MALKASKTELDLDLDLDAEFDATDEADLDFDAAFGDILYGCGGGNHRDSFVMFEDDAVILFKCDDCGDTYEEDK